MKSPSPRARVAFARAMRRRRRLTRAQLSSRHLNSHHTPTPTTMADDDLDEELLAEFGLGDDEAEKVRETYSRLFGGGAPRGDGTRALDAATTASALTATRGLNRDVQEQILERARADIVVGADRCANMSCTKAGEKTCARCKAVRYCSKDCQRADWTARHKTSCAAIDGSTEATGRRAGAPAFQTAQFSPQAMLDVFMAAETGGWYGGVSRARVYERLVISFCLRVADEYTFAGNVVGVNRASRESENLDDPATTTVMEEFRKYVKRGKTKGYLPKDWSADDDVKVCEFGARRTGVCTHWEKEDVVKKFGYASSEHIVLRRLAESFLGPIGHWL